MYNAWAYSKNALELFEKKNFSFKLFKKKKKTVGNLEKCFK